MNHSTTLDLEASDSRGLWGWVLGWAFTATAVSATGGTSGWEQSPAWSAALGIALGAAGMFAGAWWSRGRGEAAGYAGAFLLAVGILKLGLLGAGMSSAFFVGGIVGLAGETAGNLLAGRRPTLERSFRWGAGFAVGSFLMAVPGAYLAHFTGVFAEWISGRQAADTFGVLLGSALAGALSGAVAAFIGDPDG